MIAAPSYAAFQFDEVDDASITYGKDATPDALYRRLFTATQSSGSDVLSEQSFAQVPTSLDWVTWIFTATSPKDDQELLGVQGQCSGTPNTCIDLFSKPRNLSSWNRVVLVGASNGDIGANSNATMRMIDLAYEQRSGDALFVYRDGDNNKLKYRTLSNSGALGAQGTAYTLASGSARFRWIKLVPRPHTDEILVIFRDTGGALYTRIWSGTGWLNAGEVLINSSEGGNTAWDAAYLSDGTLLVTYSGGSGSTLYWRTMHRGSGETTWRGQTSMVTVEYPTFVKLSPNRSGTRIAALYATTASPTLEALMWDTIGNTASACTTPGVNSKNCWVDVDQTAGSQIRYGSGGTVIAHTGAQLVPADVQWVGGSTNPANPGAEDAVIVWAQRDTGPAIETAGIDWLRWRVSNPPAATDKFWISQSDDNLEGSLASTDVEELGIQLVRSMIGDRILLLFSEVKDGTHLHFRGGIYNRATGGWSAIRHDTGGGPSTIEMTDLLPQAEFGRPFSGSANRFLIPTIEPNVDTYIPVRAGAANAPLFLIWDAGGIIYNESPDDGDGTANADLVVISPYAWQAASCASVTYGVDPNRLDATGCPAGQKKVAISGTSMTFNVTNDFMPPDGFLLNAGPSGIAQITLAGTEAAGTNLYFKLRSNVRPDASPTQDWDEEYTATNSTHPVKLIESLTLADHTSGQVPNAFVAPGATIPFNLTSVLVFRFKLTALGGNTVTIPSLIVPITLAGPSLVLSDLSSAQLTRMTDSTVYAGTPETVGGLTRLRFANVQVTSGSSGVDFELRLNVNGLGLGDQMTLSLATSDLGVVNGTAVPALDLQTVSGAVQGAAAGVTHTVKGYDVTPSAPPNYYIGDNVSVGWTKVPSSGIQAPGDTVDVDFLENGGPGRACATSITAPPAPASCSFIFNSSDVTAQGIFRVRDSVATTSVGYSGGFKVGGTLALGAHSSGQAANLLNTAAATASGPLFKFSLTATGENVRLASLTVPLSGVSGIVTADIPIAALALTGASAGTTYAVSISGATGTITVTFPVATPLVVPTTGSDYVLSGTVNSLTPGDRMDLSLGPTNLGSPVGDTSGLALLAAGITGSVTNATHRVPETLTFANVAVVNAFTQTGALAGKTLLQTSATAAGGDVQVKRMTFTVTLAGGMAWSNVSKLELWDGGGSAIKTLTSPSDADFTTLTSTITSGSSKTYTVKGDFTGLQAGYQMTVTLASGGVVADGQTSGTANLQNNPPKGVIVPAGLTKTHTASTYTITAPTLGQQVKFQDPLTISWTPSNMSDPMLFEYKVGSGAWTPFGCSFAAGASVCGGTATSGGATSCATTIPTSVSADPNVQIRLHGKERTDCQLISPAGEPSSWPSFKVIERLYVNPPASQVPNALRQTNGVGGDPFSLNGVDLLKFQLSAQGANVTVTRLQFTVVPGGANPPIADGQIGSTNYELIDDATGAPVPGVGAQPTPDFNGLSLLVNSTTPKTYRLRANVSGLEPGETLTVTLSASGVTSSGAVTSVALAAEGAAVSTQHTVATYIVTRPVQDAQVITGTRDWSGVDLSNTVPITWQSYGQASTTPTVWFKKNDASWQQLTCQAGTSGPGVCDAQVPDEVTLSGETQLELRDGTQHIAQSRLFEIGGIVQFGDPLNDPAGLGALTNLPGGKTWIIGNNYLVSWEQQGSFGVSVDLSLDSGTTYPPGLLVGTNPTAGSPIRAVFTAACTNLSGPTCAPGLASELNLLGLSGVGVNNTAKLSVRPTVTGVATQGSRESQTFSIKPAFLDLQPSSGEVQTDVDITVTWTRLAGTESPTSVFPINFVDIKLLDSATPPNLISTLAPNIANTGTSIWTPTTAQKGTQRHLQICGVGSQSTICAISGAFDIVAPSVTIELQSQPGVSATDLFLNDQTRILWTGINSGNVQLFLQASDGMVLMDVLDNTLPVDQTVPASASPIPWQIPTVLSTPLANVHIRLQKSGIIVDSAPFAIHAKAQNVTVAPTPVLTEKPTPDNSNDVTISWQTTGAFQTKLWLKRQGDASYLPLSSFGATGADAVSGTTFTWANVLGSSKTPQATIKVTQVGDESTVFAESSPFAIVAAFSTPVVKNNQDQVKLLFNLNAPGELPLKIEWLLPRGPVTGVRVRALDLSAGGAETFTTQVTNTATDMVPQQVLWTPSGPYASVQAEVCDVDNLTVCSLSAPFTVGGISVSKPLVAQQFIIGAGGVNVAPIEWKPVGGSNTTAKLEYTVNGGPATLIVGSSASGENITNTYSGWNIPVTFTGLSDQVRVRVTDNGNGLSGDSAPFTVSGRLTILSVLPAGPYEVDQAVNVLWSAYGIMASGKLQYSVDGTTWFDGPAVVPASGQLTGCQMPQDAVGQSVQLRVVDTTPGHPASDSPAYAIAVKPKVTLTLPDPSPWAANEPQRRIQWTSIGQVDQVQLLYSVNGGVFTPMAGTPLANGMVANTGGALTWNGSFDWTAVDPGLSRDPATYAPANVVIKVVDASLGHAPLEISSAPVALIYLKVIWEVKDPVSGGLLSGLNVTENSVTTGLTTWEVTDGTIFPNSPFPSYPGVLRYYPLDLQTTLWGHPGASESAVIAGWPASVTELVDVTGDNVVDRAADAIIKEAFIELDVNKSVPWHVPMRFQYIPGVSGGQASVLITGWLEKRGVLYPQVDQLDVQIFDGNTLLRTLSSTTPDTNGVFQMTWDLKDGSGLAVDESKSYFIKGTVTTTTGSQLAGGESLDITVAKKILTAGSGAGGGVTLGELQTELTPLKTDVTEIKAIVTPLPQQLSDAQTAIQADIGSVKSDTLAIKADTGAIKAETDKISTEVIPKIDNVQAYLADPNAGLPAVLSNQTAMQDQLTAQRKGKILNRETTIEQGEAITIHYMPADPATVPTVKIYGPGLSLGPTPMTPDADGNYAFAQLFDASFQLGEYTVVVTEAASADSDGTVDNLSLKLRTPIATAQDVGTITTKLDDLSTQLASVESNLAGQLTAVQSAMATKAQVDTVITYVDELEAKWGSLSAADLQNQLAGLYTLIGAPASGTLAGDLAQVQTDMAKEASLSAIDAKLGTPTTGTIAGDIAAISGAVNYSTRFDAIDQTLANLSTQVGNPAQQASLDTAIATLTQIQTDMAKGIDLATALTKLDALQTDLTALAVQVGTPAQQASLDTAIATLNQIQTDMAKEASLQNALSTLSGVQDALTNLDAKVGTPAFGSLAADIADVKAAIGSVTGAINYTSRFDTIDQTLTALSDQVGDPAQRAALDNALAVLATIESEMAKEATLGVPANGSIAADIAAITSGGGGGGGGGDLTSIQTAVNELKSAVGTTQLASDGTTLAQLSTESRNQLGTLPPGTSVAQELGAIRTEMAKGIDLQTALGQLATLQSDLTVLAGQVGTPAQQAALDSAISTLATIQTDMAKENSLQSALSVLSTLEAALTALDTKVGTPAQEASVQTALSALATVQSDLTALSGQVGTPAQAAALQAVADQLTQVQTGLNAIPTTDYTAQLTTLQSSMDALATAIGTPAQQAALDNAVATLAAIQTDMAKGADLQTALGQLATLQTDLTALAGQVGTPAQQAALDNAMTTLTMIQADMAKEASVQTAVSSLGTLQTALASLSTQVGTPAQDASMQSALTALTDAQTALTDLSTQVGSPAQQAAMDAAIAQVIATVQAIPGATDYTTRFNAVDQTLTQVAQSAETLTSALGSPQAGSSIYAEMAKEATVAGLTTQQTDTTTLMDKLTELQSSIDSARGSSAAVGFSQSAFNAATEAVKILQQLQTAIQTQGSGSPQAQVLLGALGDQLKSISSSVTVIPSSLTGDQISEQLKELAKKAGGLASERGYHFDSLYEISETQSTDLKTVRSQVEELKALLDMQRAILQRNLDKPVVKTWFEAR